MLTELTDEAAPDLLKKYDDIRESLVRIIQKESEVLEGIAIIVFSELINENGEFSLAQLKIEDNNAEQDDFVNLIQANYELSKRVNEQDFKVMVMGEFNAGKSTFINALLQEPVLPSFSLPTTAVINEIQWGEKKKITLHYKGERKPPKVLDSPSPDTLKKHLVIDRKDRSRQQDYDRVILAWPLILCQKRVTLIDSPGLNENLAREETTMDYLNKADAVIFVTTSQNLGSALSEEKVIKQIKNLGHNDVFFIINRFDEVPEFEREEIQAYVRDELGRYNDNQGENWIFFISAYQALKAHQLADDAQKQDLLEQSRIARLEKNLTDFLVYDKGYYKIKGTIGNLEYTLVKSQKYIDHYLGMRSQERPALEAAFKEAQSSLKELDEYRQRIIKRFNLKREDIKQLMQSEFERFFRTVAEKGPEWASEHELEAPITLTSVFKLEKAIEQASEEMKELFASRTQDEFEIWQAEHLVPTLESSWQDFSEDLEADISHFLEEMDNVRLKVTGVEVSHYEDVQISKKERLLSAAGGFLTAGIGLATIGSIFGFREMLKGILPQLIIGVGIGVLTAFNPIAMFIALFGASFVQSFIKMKATNEKIKREFGKAFREQMYECSEENAKEITKQLDVELHKRQKLLDTALNSHLSGFRRQYEAVIASSRKGKETIEKENRQLQELNRKQLEIHEQVKEVNTLLEAVQSSRKA